MYVFVDWVNIHKYVALPDEVGPVFLWFGLFGLRNIIFDFAFAFDFGQALQQIVHVQLVLSQLPKIPFYFDPEYFFVEGRVEELLDDVVVDQFLLFYVLLTAFELLEDLPADFAFDFGECGRFVVGLLHEEQVGLDLSERELEQPHDHTVEGVHRMHVEAVGQQDAAQEVPELVLVLVLVQLHGREQLHDFGAVERDVRQLPEVEAVLQHPAAQQHAQHEHRHEEGVRAHLLVQHARLHDQQLQMRIHVRLQVEPVVLLVGQAGRFAHGTAFLDCG